MKTRILRSLLAVTFGLLTFTLDAEAQNERPALGERLERLERRVNEIAERQEQFLQRAEAQLERRGVVATTGNPDIHQPLPPLGRAGAEGRAPAPPHNKQLQDLLGLLFLIGLICNILLAIWIYTDIRKRGEGSGLFIAVALVAGIPAAIIYALTRIGDKKA